MEPEIEASSRSLRRPWWIALGLWLALAAVTSIGLWHLRRDAVQSQSRELGLLSLTLTDGIERGLSGADEGLHALRAELLEGRRGLAMAGPGGDARQALRTRAALMPLVDTLWLLDDSGRTIAASDQTPAPDLSVFHPSPGTLAEGAAALSRPFDGPGDKGPLIAMAVRFPGTAYAPSGWILAGMQASALLGAFSSAIPSTATSAWVVRGDGVRLTGVNAQEPTLDASTLARHLARRPELELRRFEDGSDKLVALHTVSRYDVKVLISRDLESVLASWRQAATVSGAALALLVLVMAAAVHWVQLADRRRAEAQRALQAQISRAAKLESLGTLAGSVAHDFNNLLAGIVGFGEMAQDAAPAGSDQARHIDKILQIALRGKSLVGRILTFSHAGAKASAVFELEPVVEEVLSVLSASLRGGIVLERVLQAPGACLRGDATQAFEAVMNLCTNAMQAMPQGGMLSVQLDRLQVAEPRVLSHTQLPPGNYLRLVVTDQGKGITPDVMERLFEPFFTTRAAQSGTGLGLAVVFGVVAELGGAIDVQSRPGQGAQFTLYLPESSEGVDIPTPGALQVHPGAGQRLLVVDDEPELVALTSELLTGLGYTPEGYTDPGAALQALNDDPQRFAAVITDEVMPGLTGTQLTQALRQRAPHIPVLLVSGYGGALLAQRAGAVGVTRLLAKPLQRNDLARALAEVLR
ncbi:ATP-binding protein [Acidovorax sp. CCYZU-2555]|uniref:ATP-binding protein n=1 Tax=Acidovorax sp. CCYZU-2555 TaxID=2835042 RepID=UPI001BCAA77F|nr:ATP-binding protein [Acidovorax sp. CCYZU-2555]MBS7777217.1 response regulator [Acidovorax sp. CCYZU-2555]